MTLGKRSKLKSQEKPQKEDLLEQYSPLKIGKILPTTTKKKPNIFDEFRPKPGECLDYNISETFVKMDVGDTKINVKQTEARFVPAPPQAKKPDKKKKVMYSHGGPPQWKFVDEIWREQRDRLQIQLQREFQRFFVRKKRATRQSASILHNWILSMVGPDWFQELSPKQLKTANQLKYCMAQDYRDRTIIRTKENIGFLGLVPRPNQRHIELALQLCCGIDVEFLLILYQLMNPRRKEYSINDRLLLSAVVHLTMPETLRELHIRIPSPPRHGEFVSNISENPVKKRYKSPYLVPFIFKPEAPKHTGVYKNKHFQYPESTYFSYVEALYHEMQFTENILTVDIGNTTDPVDLEIMEDTINAQKWYNKLPYSTGNINLMRPTIKKVCLDFENYSIHPVMDDEKLMLPRLAELEDSKEKCTCLEPPEDTDDDSCEFDFFEECDCEEHCCCKEKSKLFMKSLCKRCIARRQPKNAENIILGVKMIDSNTVAPIIGGTFVQKDCDCLQKYKETLMGVAARNRIKCQKAKYVIGGVALTHIGPVYLISDVSVKDDVPENPEACLECKSFAKKFADTEEDETSTSRFSDKEESECQCKKELDTFLQHKCTCEQCRIAEAKTNTTYILQGVRKMDDETTVNIIGGVHDQRCDCLTAYLDRMNKLEQYKSRVEARCRMKSHKKKFAITGVVTTPEGPVYCIGGVRSPVRCVCAEVAEERERAEESTKRMAKMPPTGRIKYEISGVKHGSRENTFIISKALPVTDCPCEKLYHTFQEAHGVCLDAYEEYLRRIEQEMDECNEESEDAASENVEEALPEPLLDTETLEDEPALVEYTETITTTTITTTILKVVVTVTVTKDGGSQNNMIVNVKQSSDENEEGPDHSEKLKDIERQRTSEPDTKPIRFVILDKIPCDRRRQLVILEKVLASMAEDGFPLAKLPDCHKLPLFRLWMEFRCGRAWSQQDRISYENISKFCYKHTQMCYHDIPPPTLGISKRRENTMTWKDAKFCRKLVEEKSYSYHRQIKQQLINSAREFFPLTFSYEFPSPTFRDCYFAYLPGKEEDLFVG